MKSKTILGENIYRWRKSLRWSQADLAQEIGVSRSAVALYEAGDTAPSRANMKALGNTFNVEPHRLEKQLLSPADIAALKAGGPVEQAAPEPAAQEPYIVVQATTGAELAREVNQFLQQGFRLRGPMLAVTETVQGQQVLVLLQNVLSAEIVETLPQ